MPLIYKFFNNSDINDRLYNANDLNEYLGNLVTEGVILNTPDSLRVVRNAGRLLEANAGYAVFNNCFVQNTTPASFTIEANTTNSIRIDRCVLRWSFMSRKVDYIVLRGLANGSPQNIERGRLLHDIVLAEIRVRPNATTIADDDITDTRSDAYLCGIVQTKFDQISNNELTQIINTDFERFMSDLQNDLLADNAGRIQEQLNDLRDNKFPANTYATSTTNGILYNAGYNLFNDLSNNVQNNYLEYAPGNPETEIQLTLQTGINSPNVARPIVKRIGKFVTVRGTIRGITGSSQTIAILPEWFRPPRTIYFVGTASPMNLAAELQFVRYRIGSDGMLVMENNSSGTYGTTLLYNFEETFIIDAEVAGDEVG